LLGFGALRASAAAPDWLQVAARDQLPKYPEKTVAVMLRNDQIATVKNNGEVTTVYRRAYRILRPEGRDFGVVQIFFDSETRITSVKGWSIPAAGGGYEVGEKDSVDTILFSGNLYDDDRQKVLRIPASEPGAVIGYEYEQRRRTAILQDQWMFQQPIPVRQARFELHLPGGWETREFWANHPAAPLQPGGANQRAWELKDIPAIEQEPAMPAWQATAGRLLLSFVAPNGGSSLKSWAEVGQWYTQLSADRRQSTPDLRQKVAELTAGAPDSLAKIRALAGFVQREVRYVAVEIGIGGYQPHPAQEILRNRYGDCKDKATLLSAMLSEIGVASYYVLINTRRGVVMPEFPSPLAFNHAILAIRLPADAPQDGLYSSLAHPQMGRLLFFDPTNPYIQLGHLPSELHANYGLLVGNSGGDLTKLPLAPASVNVLQRTAKLQLTSDGTLRGNVQETRSGTPAADFRGSWLNTSESSRRKSIQAFFGPQATGVELSDISVTNVDTPGSDPVLLYSFQLGRYVTSAGGLLLMRPRILAEWGDDLMENGERKQAIEYHSANLRLETIEIALPDGYSVDELPSPVQADAGALSYSSKTELDGRVLRYSRRLEIRDVLVKTEQLPDLKKFYRLVAAAEKARAVLKKD
jgi:hypothetical protein